MPRKPNTNGNHYNDPFPSALRKLKDEHKTTQDQLAKVLGVAARQSVTGYIDGSTIPTAEKIIAIADYYDVSSDYLLGRTESPTTNEDIKAAIKVTGLSQRAVENIAKLQRVQWQAVDAVNDSISAPVVPLKEFEKMLESKQFLYLCLRLAMVGSSCSLLEERLIAGIEKSRIPRCLDSLDLDIFRLSRQAEELAEDLYHVTETKKKAEALSNGERS